MMALIAKMALSSSLTMALTGFADEGMDKHAYGPEEHLQLTPDPEGSGKPLGQLPAW
jgi:hypothetical protein